MLPLVVRIFTAVGGSAGLADTRSRADPELELAREQALLLYKSVASNYGRDPKRWASREGMTHAVGRAALQCSLGQLSDWLAHGGMAAGAPHGCDCTLLCVLQTLRFANAQAPSMYAHTG